MFPSAFLNNRPERKELFGGEDDKDDNYVVLLFQRQSSEEKIRPASIFQIIFMVSLVTIYWAGLTQLYPWYLHYTIPESQYVACWQLLEPPFGHFRFEFVFEFKCVQHIVHFCDTFIFL